MQRRSSSNRTPRKKYTTDAFASIPELRETSESPSESAQVDRNEDGDDAFMVDAEAEVNSDNEESDREATNGEEDANDDEEVDEDGDSIANTPRRAARVRRPRATYDDAGDQLHIRGVADAQRFHLQASKAAKAKLYWGADPRDMDTVERAVQKWQHFPVLPSRAEPSTDVFHAPFIVDEKAYRQSNDSDWSWCCDTDNERSVNHRSSIDEVRHLLPSAHRIFMMGPVTRPKQFELSAQEYVPIQTAYVNMKARPGFVLNAGARVQCVEWLPNQKGSFQYLAITTTTTRADYPPLETPEPPAYTPTTSFPTLVQIWRFNVEEHPARPSLKMLLSTNYGDIKRLKFCPFPARSFGRTPTILGGVWSDGGLRVAVLPEISGGDEVDVYHIEKVVLESKAPGTVYTCFTWMTPQRVAAGCANGCVAIFNLSGALQKSLNAKPRKFSAVSTTYILDIVSCSPACPSLLFTTSMDGFCRMTDTSHTQISSPSATILTNRNRTILTSLVWHNHAKSVILTDDTFAIRSHLVRRIFNLFTVGRTHSSPTTMAASQCHPCVLVGSAGGEVQSFNPLLRIVDNKHIVRHQTWFAHEWRRGNESDASKEDASSQRIAKDGLSRFTEGYKPEKAQLNQVGRVDNLNTVYEKQSTVTALCWNPNPHVSGWAAAGMADGLVRVEDISMQSG